MKRHYQEPDFEVKSFIRQDVIVMSGGDGYADDPWSEGFGGGL